MSITDFMVFDRGEKHAGRYEFIVNKPIAIIGEEVYVLESFFSDSKTEPKGWHGATGYHMRPVYQDEIDEAIDSPDEEMWRYAVAHGETTEGLEDWWDLCCEEAVDNNLFYPFDDDSFRLDFASVMNTMSESDKKALEIARKENGHDKEPVGWTCQGCGRCMPEADKIDFALNIELLELVKEFED